MTSESEENPVLRQYFDGLAAVLALPGLWRGYEPAKIAASLLDALMSLLHLKSAYIHVEDPASDSMIEAWRPQEPCAPVEFIHALESGSARGELASTKQVVLSAVGEPIRVSCSCARFPGEHGLVLTAAPRSDYPSERERFLLKAAIDQATVAISDAQRIACERAARASAEVAVRNRDELMEMTAHDLRTPLAALMAGAQLVLCHASRNPTGPADTARLSAILAQVERMRHLIGETRYLSRLQTGVELLLRLDDIDPIPLAKWMVQYHDDFGPPRRFVLDSSEHQVFGKSDGDRIEQVVDNLLSNAVKYSMEGSTGTITVRGMADSAETWALLAVQDEGIGIPRADLPGVFERFHRGANVTERVPRAGIGLASAQQLVALHSGTITVESAEDVVSTFTVRLPQRHVDDDAQTYMASQGMAGRYVQEDAGSGKWSPRASWRAETEKDVNDVLRFG